MNSTTSFMVTLHSTIRVLWSRRYLVIVPTLLSWIVGGVCVSMYSQPYSIKSYFLLSNGNWVNPFVEKAPDEKTIEGQNDSLNTLLHNRDILQEIAKRSGLITNALSVPDRELKLQILAKKLNAKLTQPDTLELSYENGNTAQVLRVMEVATDVFHGVLTRAVKSSGVDITQNKQVVDELASSIAKQASTLADLQAKYTPTHSAVRRAKEALAQLQRQYNQLAYFSKDTRTLSDSSEPILQSAAVRLLERSYIPQPVNPYLSIVLIAATFFAGIGMGIGLAVIFEYTDTTIRRRTHAEKLTQRPVLGRISPA